MRKLLINLFLLCAGKDGIRMMAMLWAQEIMNQGNSRGRKENVCKGSTSLKRKGEGYSDSIWNEGNH